MAINNARPTIWSAKILRALNTLLVFGGPGVVNRDYEGEVSEAGDAVKILTLGDVKISSYTKNTDMSAPEALTDAAQTLVIDQQKSFNFGVDNIDRLQANVDLMSEAARRAAYGLKKEADTFIAEKWKEIDTANKGASFKWGTAETIYSMIVELGVLLDKSDTPDDGMRFVVIPPDAVGNLQKDIRFVGYGTQPNRETLQKGLGAGVGAGFGYNNGLIGEVAGFKVYQSNQVPVESSKYKVIAGHPMAWSYVEQITKVVAYEPPLQFTDALKGLHVYGAKVVRPSQLAWAIAEA
jgi:hypothetical protein